MQIIISGRNTKVGDGLRSRIDDRFQRLSRFEPRASRVEVTLAEEKKRNIAEALMSVDGAGTVFARAEADDARAAVDRLYDKMSRQLRRGRSRRREHKGVVPEPTPFPPDEPDA